MNRSRPSETRPKPIAWNGVSWVSDRDCSLNGIRSAKPPDCAQLPDR